MPTTAPQEAATCAMVLAIVLMLEVPTAVSAIAVAMECAAECVLMTHVCVTLDSVVVVAEISF